MQATLVLLPSSRQIGDTNQWSQAQLIENNSRSYDQKLDVAPTAGDEASPLVAIVALHLRGGVLTTAAPAVVSLCSFAAAVATIISSSSLSIATCASLQPPLLVLPLHLCAPLLLVLLAPVPQPLLLRLQPLPFTFFCAIGSKHPHAFLMLLHVHPHIQ